MQVLQREIHQRLPGTTLLAVQHQVAELWHHVGIYHLQHCSCVTSVLARAGAAEAEGAGEPAPGRIEDADEGLQTTDQGVAGGVKEEA